MSIDHSKYHPAHDPRFMHFPSRRSTVFSTKGMVACSQPLAAQAGLEILNKGGNAADAAVAVAAALNVTEPTCTGIGGDIFCLFYDAKTKEVSGINGSGRAPMALTLEHLRKQGITGSTIPLNNLNSVTCPGAAAGWWKTIEEFGSGRLKMPEILAPAIRMAKEGVPEHEINANAWEHQETLLKNASANWKEMMMPNGHAPLPSNIMVHPELAETFEAVAKGPEHFYEGRIADAIVELVQSGGGVMTQEDLKNTRAERTDAISYTFHKTEQDPGVTLNEHAPNGQGLVALIALGIIEQIEKLHNIQVLELDHNGPEYLHILIEALRLAFADAQHYIADPDFYKTPVKELLSEPYLRSRAKLFDPTKASNPVNGDPFACTDTVYFTTSDSEGNACSFIASNYAGFGTGAIPKGCGFTLQNRGAGFRLEEGHFNCVAGGKRGYHTIIPGMVTSGDELVMSMGVMGGYMQPQGHVQVLLNTLRGFSPQASLDAPRFCISAGLPDAGTKNAKDAGNFNAEIWFEDGIAPETVEKLRQMGHRCEVAKEFQRAILGRGQVIRKVTDPSGRTVWAGGSDPRADGCAVGQI